MRLRLVLLTFLLFCLFAEANAQDMDAPSSDLAVAESATANKDYVYLLNANTIRFDKLRNPDAQILRGDVAFRHDSMYMYCDSALFYKDANSFNAYNNIRIEQGDTLFMYGDSLYYDGNLKLLRVRDNVRIENRTMILLTDSLNYDRNIGLGWFFDGGTLLDEESTLISEYGQFDTNTKYAVFIDGVSLDNPDYRLTTDTLTYNTDTHTAFLTCPTTIVSDDNVINSSRGQFNTDNDNAVLLDRSVITQDDGENRMTADSILYDKSQGQVTAFGNVIINDYKDKIDVKGEYVYYNQDIDSAVVTGKALLIEYSGGDSMFVHADTFRLVTFYNEEHDSVVERHVRGFNKVRAYRIDMQMVADSMQFSTADSTLTLYYDPIVWSDEQQVLGEKIVFYLNDSTIDYAHVIGQALYVQKNDTVHYNQIAGREMKAFFRDSEIYKAEVHGNVFAVFYPYDEDSVMIGMNTSESSNLTAYFKERTVNRVVITGHSNGIMYPMEKIDEKKMFLNNFSWFDRIRPFDALDVFFWRGKNEGEKLRVSKSNKEVPLPTLNRNKR